MELAIAIILRCLFLSSVNRHSRGGAFVSQEAGKAPVSEDEPASRARLCGYRLQLLTSRLR